MAIRRQAERVPGPEPRFDGAGSSSWGVWHEGRCHGPEPAWDLMSARFARSGCYPACQFPAGMSTHAQVRWLVIRSNEEGRDVLAPRMSRPSLREPRSGFKSRQWLLDGLGDMLRGGLGMLMNDANRDWRPAAALVSRAPAVAGTIQMVRADRLAGLRLFLVSIVGWASLRHRRGAVPGNRLYGGRCCMPRRGAHRRQCRAGPHRTEVRAGAEPGCRG